MANYMNHAQHVAPATETAQAPGQDGISIVNDPAVSIIKEISTVEDSEGVAEGAVDPAPISIADFPTNVDLPTFNVGGSTSALLSRLGKAVKAYRVSHGYTSEDLASVLNDAAGKKVFSMTQAKRLENGKLPVTIEQLVAISALLGGESIVSAKLDEILEATVKNLLAGVSLTADNIDLFV